MRFLIVEDEKDVAQALANGFRNLGYAVDIAEDGEQGWYMASVNDYDLLLLDLNLPGIDGIEVCRRIKETNPGLLILMLTARDRLTDRIKGLDMGADDYLCKPFHFSEISAHVRALLRRDIRARETHLECGDLRLDPVERVAWKANHRLELTRKEFGLLEYLMRHPGEIITQEELMEHVWDSGANPLSSSVRVHIASLRQKLEDNPASPSYIQTVLGEGYRFIDHNDKDDHHDES